MTVQLKPDFKTLENNIIDVIKEEQIKLGYRKETIRLYYPMDSLNSLLGADMTRNELMSVLDQFCHYAKEHLGEVEYSCNDKRFCIVIPEKGVAYVQEEVKDRSFLEEFIGKIREHNCSIEDILQIFYRYSSHVKCEKINNGEFDYLIYFEDGNPDSYRYCIKFEECHAIYHRFTISDYENFIF
jgi:hypothetical protein